MIDNQSDRKTRLLLALVLLLYLLLAISYGITTPLFEAPDEHFHFFTIQYIAQNGRLPTIESGGDLARQEAAQPPLYYVLAAPILSVIDTTDTAESLWYNPTARNGEAQPINVNDFIHREREAWPWRGYPLAAHLVRFLSAVIGLGTLVSIFSSGRLLWPRQPATALLATALVAFLPQFGFLHGAITNDVLIIFLSSAVLWQLLWMWKREPSPARLLLLGATIGLAILSKMAGLGLLLLAFAVLAMMAWRDWRFRPGEEGSDQLSWLWQLVRRSFLVAVPALLLSGWLLWRNWVIYGDITAVSQFVAMAGKDRQFTLRQVWHDIDRVALSTVGYFGWMNVLSPRWIYLTWTGILALAGGGWLLRIWRFARQEPASRRDVIARRADNLLIALWMGAWVAIVCLAWLRFMMQTPADQGRLLFPALLPVALFIARGLSGWRLRWLSAAAVVAALITSAYAALILIPSIYNQATIISPSELPAEGRWPPTDLGMGLELLAAVPRTAEVRPGEWAWADVYWRAVEPPPWAPLQELSLYGRENALVDHQEYYHGGGTFPADTWPAGAIIKDRVAVQLQEHAELPVQLRLLLTVDDAYDPVEIARFKGVPDEWPEVSGSPLAVFGDQIELVEASFAPQTASPGEEVAAALRWRVSSAPGKELTTFFHLGAPEQAPLAQGDGPALDGAYPVNLWAAGEVIDDGYSLIIPDDLPPGRYPLHIGFYDPTNGARAAVTVNNEEQPHQAYFLGWLQVE
ncbi:MAG: ArnT family glycosyltransferase [Candidatus Promineifilaceae bacterium]